MRLEVKVTAHSSRNAVIEAAGRLKVYVTAAPERGKANAAVIELLAEHFGVNKARVRLIRGATASLKSFEILI